MAKLFLIVQARMTSTRLPKKVMLPLCGTTVLEVFLKRIKSFKNNIIIATTNDGSEEDIVNTAKSFGIKYYRGDTNNVLSRYYESAVKYQANDEDIIVRCTSDCPLLDEKILEECIDSFKTLDIDYLTCGFEGGFPRGMDVEVFRFKLLKEAFLNAKSDYEKEHVTPYIHTTKKDEFKILEYKNKYDHSKYRLTLDEQEDYILIKEIYKRFDNRLDFSYDELISLLKKEPELLKINEKIKQK